MSLWFFGGVMRHILHFSKDLFRQQFGPCCMSLKIVVKSLSSGSSSAFLI